MIELPVVVAEEDEDDYDEDYNLRLEDLYRDDTEDEDNMKDKNVYSTTVVPTPTATALMFLEQPVGRYQRIWVRMCFVTVSATSANACWLESN